MDATSNTTSGSASLDMSKILPILSKTTVFSQIPQPIMEKIFEKLNLRTVEKGQQIFKAGSEAEALYIISSGSVELYTTAEDLKIDMPIGALQKYDVFGEVSMILDQPHSASARALVKTELLELTKKIFVQVMKKIPDFSIAICKVLGERLKASSQDMSIPFISLDSIKPNPLVFKSLSLEFMREHLVAPLTNENQRLVLAMSNPLDLRAMKQIREQLGNINIKPVGANGESIRQFIDTTIVPVLEQGEILVPEFFERVTLTVRDAENNERVFKPTKASISVGRKPGNDVVISGDHTVSGLHAIFSLSDDRVTVEDKNSSNGVFVNDERIATLRELHAEDIVTVGHSTFIFTIEPLPEIPLPTAKKVGPIGPESDETPMGNIVKNFFPALAKYVYDPSVSEIMVNGKDDIFIERNGVMSKAKEFFEDEAPLYTGINNMAQFTGKVVTDDNPYYSADLAFGYRSTGLVHPYTPTVAFNIRKVEKKEITLDALVAGKSLEAESAEFLKSLIAKRRNILCTGEMSSGKSTLLRAMADFIPDEERLVLIEIIPEISLKKPNILQLFHKEVDKHGKTGLTIRDLLDTAVKMRPRRIILGTLRDDLIWQFTNILSSGCRGSLSTLNATSPENALLRLELGCLQSRPELPAAIIKRLIAASYHYIVHTNHFADGSRKVSDILKIDGIGPDGNIVLSDPLDSPAHD
jgi:pilus assembly protein CpaF